MRLLAKGLATLVFGLVGFIALGAAALAVSGPLPMRGQMVDIGGRRLHLICVGPKGPAPTVLFEPGAFGFSADFAVVQDKVAAQGLHTCAYDRAGMGLSVPGPAPRTSAAIAADLEKLLAAAHEDGPFILVGHSMAGLHLRLFATRNPGKVAGLVLVDATTPEATDLPQVRKFVDAFTRASQLAAFGAKTGLYAPLSYTWFGDKIGLTPAASKEKRRAFASARHNKWAADEVSHWLASAEEAKAGGRLDPEWPVAVVTAGASHGRLGWKSLQATPARESRHGYFENVDDAGHATLLGVKHADAIVRGVDHVLAAWKAIHAAK